MAGNNLNYVLAFLMFLMAFLVFVLTEKADAAPPSTNTYFDFTSMSKAEQEALDQLIYYESNELLCGIETQMAIAQVVFNRCLSPAFPDNIYDVIFESGEFDTSRFFEKPLLMDEVETINGAIENVLNGDTVIPYDYFYFTTDRAEVTRSNLWIGEWKWSDRDEAFKPMWGCGLYFDKEKVEKTK